MVDTTQSPLAMLVLVTPYTILYVVNELFLSGVLDKIHYFFFELIFVFAFRKVFGLPDLTDRFFSSLSFKGPFNIQSVESIQPLKTSLATTGTVGATGMILSTVVSTATSTASKGNAKDSIDQRTALQCTKLAKSTSKAVARVRDERPYAKELAAMEKKFMDYIHKTDIWEKVYEDTSINVSTDSNSTTSSWIQVFQYKSRPMCYKIIAYMNSSPAVLFDTLCDLDRRSEWDPMCVEARVLEEVSPGTTIQYVRTKAVWPTASRDTVVLGTVKDLGPDKGLFMVNSSIEHASMPERVKEKIVRMETAVAGHIITPVGEKGEKSKLVQILDADLKGWIPDKVIQMVSTKAVPDGLRAVNQLIPKIEPYYQSDVLLKALQAQMELDTTLIDPRPNENEGELLMGSEQERLALEDMDPEEVEALALPRNMDDDKCVSRHTLRHQRSESDITLSKLSDRQRAVEDEDGMSRRATRQEALSRHSHKPSATNTNNNNNSRKESERTKRSSHAGAMEKSKPTTGAFRAFWEGVKENLGFGLGGKANKILVAVIVVAVLGSSVARLKRR
ncbi:MAG: hypothetical protein J3Q66DRAFT_95567 [Benniella sp.]|nr:MAG: hypothetical protein J3Q66DRAFT_95567 [Benniella sp.]